mgnify:CR=1 FL=1
MNILVENVSVELLRAQRTKLLDFLNPSDEIQGLIHLLKGATPYQALCCTMDFIGGMTDNYAVDLARQLSGEMK